MYFLRLRRAPISSLFPYTTLFRSSAGKLPLNVQIEVLDIRRSDVWIDAEKISQWRWTGVHGRFFRRRSTHPNALYPRSEEHTSELQSRFDLVCRLLLEK